MPVNANCIAVPVGGTCPACGWVWNSPEHTEPHPVLPHGGPKAPPLGHCANCDAQWNLDAVKCSNCHWEPMAPEAYEKLRAEKNKARKVTYQAPLPVREDPVKVHGERGGMQGHPEPAKHPHEGEATKAKANEEHKTRDEPIKYHDEPKGHDAGKSRK